MRLVTYNIWNHDSNFDKRIDLLCDVVKKEKIDVLVLQEVRSIKVVKYILTKCEFKEYQWKKYHDCQEGLAIFSNYNIKSIWTNWDDSTDVHNSGSMCIEVICNDKRISISNVHLDYKYARNRELEIIKLINYIKKLNSDYNILLGDFNTYPDSSVHRYLTGRYSLDNNSARWIDLGEVYSIRNKIPLKPTIDFYNNPRWDDENILDIPGRFDWVLLENPYPGKYPELLEYKIIGTKRVNGLTPSDHYGVLCHIKF